MPQMAPTSWVAIFLFSIFSLYLLVVILHSMVVVDKKGCLPAKKLGDSSSEFLF